MDVYRRGTAHQRRQVRQKAHPVAVCRRRVRHRRVPRIRTPMHTTIMDFPLTVTSILRYGTTIHADHVVTTAMADGFRDVTFAELGVRVARLANGLRRVGITGDERVATFMWNTQEHLAAYFAVPCMGAVLHTLNVRLSDEQI